MKLLKATKIIPNYTSTLKKNKTSKENMPRKSQVRKESCKTGV